MKIFKKIKKGFTIVELVIVIAVIAVLTAILVPTFINISKKANQASDQSLKNYLNKALALVENDPELNKNGENKTMHYAIEDLDEYGITLSKIVTKSDEKLVWKQADNRFYFESQINSDAERAGCWRIQKSVADGQKYAVYADKGFATGPVNLYGVSFDVGYNKDISVINYINTSETAKTVSIRTNGGKLTVDAPNDTIRHFGVASETDLNSVSSSSYYEHGAVNQINITKGRLVFTNEKDSSVNTVYLKKTNDNYDGIILATQSGATLPTFIARDSVSEPETGEKLVVTIQTNVNEQGQDPEKTEAIYLYPEKDVKEETNGYDVTDLGLLVVEAISSTAQAEAAEVISDPEVLERVESTKADCAAIVDSIGYTTFASAWSAGTNKTVVLLKDVILNGMPVVNTKSVDLNQHSLTLRGAQLGDGQECGIWISCDWGNDLDGKLTLKNGTLMLPGTNYNHYGIYCYGSLLNCQNLVIQSNCNEAIHFEGHQYGTNYTSELNNVTIHSTGTGIQSNGYKGSFFGNVIPTVNLSNSTIYSENGTAFAINGSKANVTNSIFNPSAGQKSLHVYSSGTASGLAPELTLTGSVMCNGDSDINKLCKNAGTVTIKEGTYNFNPTNYVDGEVYSISSQNNLWIVAIK